MRYITAAIIILMLGACAHNRVPDTVYQKVYIPILFCPAPPVIEFPEYYAKQLTDEQLNDIGELTKAYVISSQEAANRIDNLQAIYDLYSELAARSEARLTAIEALGGEVDRSLMEQAKLEINQMLSSISAEIETQNEMHSTQMLQSLNQMNENP